MSSLNLNKVILCGRLTADPELKQTQSGVSVLSLTIAINRRFQRSNNAENGQGQTTADFITIVAWRQIAEFISKYFKKGSAICVTGSIQTRRWTDQQGQNRYATEVYVDEAMFVDSRSERDSGSGEGGADYVPDSYKGGESFSNMPGSDFSDAKSDDDLPF
ncbi:MAG: single-stranded DNA-binding protein [Clostridia bacterium]|nr:single-stranded DNA-binding protein [Clostridia bacterium]MBQ7728080.1 single-stranded DNA-binding protein [Clostridia bacterium]